MSLRTVFIATVGISFVLALHQGHAKAPIHAKAPRPNVVLIMTDDQGIGDFGATGNNVIATPHLDKMAANSAAMTTFYVSPVCSPTRACLMTGRYNYRTRCIDTWLGRSMMEPEEVTVAELLSNAGYATGIFGKWHLGDCYPMRPMDQGFDEVLVHRGGGLAQPSEPRENSRRYTDPILFHNGKQVETKGFCTDVYFDAALKFIDDSHQKEENFFVYLPTNAPHGPYHDVPEKLREQYMEKDPEESTNLVDKKPEVFNRLKADYDRWFDDVSSTRPDNYAPPRIWIGTPHEEETVLTRQDWRGGTWATDAIGSWQLHVAASRSYDIRLEFDARPEPGTARLSVAGQQLSQQIDANATSCLFKSVELAEGDLTLGATLTNGSQQRGVYQVVVK